MATLWSRSLRISTCLILLASLEISRILALSSNHERPLIRSGMADATNLYVLTSKLTFWHP
eukprot:CAMPEP_0173460010 /NCGR_PEP_ID=MMETSP1357-20121228/62408_1 /TAXON_ID=77926 /ORGANISM="Hemiselmis rufescens, Strain PCC563" /LENGTH=60 /DNA_ID=CAMNT_0014427527 /DNA_START=192 /DNA_END=374 /DNA_ORIENTATION=+